MSEHVHVAIVGSGFSGLGMAIRLRQQGIENVAILERADRLGGTWRENTYPGCACDIPSKLYSFSFAPNPNWTRAFPGQREIWDYLEDCADRFGVRRLIRFGHDVERMTWDADDHRWTLQTSEGTLTADVVVAAPGGLSNPSVPDLPGLDLFAGTVFHSATWNHEHDLTGARVAVVGTGASAIQFVPQIQPHVGALRLFQRTAPWVVPRRDRAFSRGEIRLYNRLPGLQRLGRGWIYATREAFYVAFHHPRLMGLSERMATAHLARQVPDPALRAKLTPGYRMGCKRILPSDDYYPSLMRPNVKVVTDGIREIRERSILTDDGTEHEVDTIILATGFHVTDVPMAQHIVGREGRTLAQAWDGSPRTHMAMTVAGFPNLFLLAGPNAGLGHNSILYMIESQITYVLSALRLIASRRLAAIEVTQAAQDEFSAEIDRRTEGSVWIAGGCRSWYLDRTGRNSVLWPGPTWEFRRRTREVDPAQHRMLPARGPLSGDAASDSSVPSAA